MAPGIFSPPPPLYLGRNSANPYAITLKSMITSWWVIYGSWAAAALVIASLHQPGIAAVYAAAGIGADAVLQKRLRQRLVRAEDVDPQVGLDQLGWMVALRFSLGVCGPLAVVLAAPKTEAFVAFLLIQAWSVCVALVQFVCAPKLLRRAFAPILLAMVAGLWPLFRGPSGVAVLEAGALLVLIVAMIAHETHRLWQSWAASVAQTETLLAALSEAKDQAVIDRQMAEAGSKAKSEFLATISHEIRTPLNGVLGMAQAMSAGDLSLKQRSQLGIIEESGTALLAILNDVLDMSKIEAGKLSLEAIPFEPAGVLHHAYKTFIGAAANKGLSFELTIDRSARGVFTGDPARLRQIVNNLISNAIKFTTAGTVLVSARNAGDVFLITVADTGIGMSASHTQRLFEKFEQGETSTTRTYGGTGLGLAICANLVEMMGGAITVSSQPGFGSTFEVSIPLARADSAPSSAKAVWQQPTEAVGLRILAAEDNENNRVVLQALLAQFGAEPTLVTNGREAVLAWDANDWDVILMDSQMPDMDGLTATRMIRERERLSARLRTPIIALTANAMVHQLQRCRDAGMDDHVSKPIDTRQLLAALQWATQYRTVAAERAA